MASGSVLEAIVQLYSLTAEKRYLDFATYIVNGFEQEGSAYIFTGLLAKRGVDKVGNGKAYEMLSVLVGMACYSRYVTDPRIMPALENAWTDIVTNRLYLSGTISSIEHFRPDHVLPANNKSRMGEGCATITWLQFNWHLLRITGNPKYANQMERTIYNAMLAAFNPQTGCVSYFTPLVGKKPHNCDITCCMSSVPRGIALLPQMLAGRYKKGIMVSICNPFTLTTQINGKPLTLQAASQVPLKGGISFNITSQKADKFPDIWFRAPEWAKNLTLNNKAINLASLPDRLIKAAFVKPGNSTIGFSIQDTSISGLKNSYNGCQAWEHGPQVLSLDAALHTSILEKYHSLQMAPISINNKLPEKAEASKILPHNWIGVQVYSVSGILEGKKHSYNLVPYAEAGQLGEESTVWLPGER